MSEMTNERAVHTHLTKTQQYLKSVASFVNEQPSETPMIIHLGEDMFRTSAGQISDMIKNTDKELYNLQHMNGLPTVDFVITDNCHYHAKGQFLGAVAKLFFDMIIIPNIEDRLVSEIQDILKEERLSMTMGYRKGIYECILRPQYHAKTNVILGRADTYIGAMDRAFKKVGNIAV